MMDVALSGESVVTGLAAILGLAAGWGGAKANGRGHGAALRVLFEWKDAHTKESGEFRAEFEHELGLLRERMARKETQNDDILRRLDAIDASIRTLAERRHTPGGGL